MSNYIPKKVLVLGAGSSFDFGFPVGSELTRKIIEVCNSKEEPKKEDPKESKLQEEQFKRQEKIRELIRGIDLEQSDLDKFSSEFAQSQANSIDAFLGRRPEFAKVGKRAIAAVLLDLADKARLVDSTNKWQRVFLNHYLHPEWEKVDFSRIAIVTFNYELSFEYYLLFALMAAYGKTREEVCEKLKELKIVHVYGSLGHYDPTESHYIEFGTACTQAIVASAAETIHVITAERHDLLNEPIKDRFAIARKLLWDADGIAFLGFGFDPINLMRLDASISCKRMVLRESSLQPRRICATCFQLTNKQRLEAIKSTSGQIGSATECEYLDLTCLNFLYETQFLEWSTAHG